MKKTLFYLAAVVVLMTGGQALAAEATGAIDVNSAYVWRGITFNDGLVVQPSIDVTSGGFGINVWGNYDVGDYDNTLDDNEFSEIDITPYYGFSLQNVEIELGLAEYLFPAGEDGTRELYASLGWPVLGGLSLGLAAYCDVDEVDGWYGNLSASYGLDVTDALGVEVSAAAGLADTDFAEAYGGDDGGWYDYCFSLKSAYTVSDALSLEASINYSDTLDKDVLPDDVVDTNLYGGISVAYTF
ncbi:MAG: MltA-interacting MipA family protein [Thermodesulfobacteriota bacterium]